ncbi:MAG TPA: hypothetical protein VH206_01830 [Xanthobacteraceae bacterium]|nr:hypothetical protein [Xanthobacteraceae bacterium]
MAAFDQIRDPIIRLYAGELQKKLMGGSQNSQYALYNARRSVFGNLRIPDKEKQDAYITYSDAERSRWALVRTLLNDHEDIRVPIGELRKLIQELSKAQEYFKESRNYFQRFTVVDSNLRLLATELGGISRDLALLEQAYIHNDDVAKKQIYDHVLREELEQLDAPYLFEIVDFIIEIVSSPEGDSSTGATEGLAILVKEASNLAGRLTQTNIDRRFLSAINEYVDALTEANFSPIKVDLFSNRLRFYLIEMKDEIPGFAIAELSALLLSQERVLRQFPVWRAFEADASKFDPDEQTAQKQRNLLESIAADTRQFEGVASDKVREALNRLEETGTNENKQKTAALGVWRAVENLIKINIRHVIDSVKLLQTSLTNNQIRYFKYLERLLPLLRLYAQMDPSRAWLLPVIQWLEDTLKSIKK